MSLAQLQQEIQTDIQNGLLSLAGIAQSGGLLPALLSNIPGGDKIVVQNANLATAPDGSLAVTGNVTLFNIPQAGVEIDFKEAGAVKSCDLTVTYQDAAPLHLPDLSWLAVTRFKLSVSLADVNTVTGIVDATLTVKQKAVAVEFQVTATAALWMLTLAADALPALGLTELANLASADLSFFPSGLASLGDVSLANISLSVDTKAASIASIHLATQVSGKDQVWQVFPDKFAVSGVSLDLTVNTPGKAATRTIEGSLQGQLLLFDSDLTVSASKPAGAANWMLEADLAAQTPLNLNAVVRDLLPKGVALPPEVPDVTLSGVKLTAVPDTGVFTFDATCATRWQLPFGVANQGIDTTTVHIARDASTGSGAAQVSGAIHALLTAQDIETVTVVDGLLFTGTNLSFQYDGKSDWSVSGSIAATVFDHNVTLAASVTTTADARTFMLDAGQTGKGDLVTLPGIGGMTADSVAITIQKALKAKTKTPGTAHALDSTSPYTWDVTIAGGLHFDPNVAVTGSVQLYDQGKTVGLVFKATNADVSIPIPSTPSSVHLGWQSVGVTGTRDSGGKTKWAFDAEVDLWFTEMPKGLQSLFPATNSPCKADFKADAAGAALTIDHLVSPVEIKYPDTNVGSLHLKWGTGNVEAANFTLQLGSDISFSMDAGVGIPDQTNTLFGTKSDGTPSVNVFNTYRKGDDSTVTRLRVEADVKNGLSIRAVSSPFLALQFKTEGANTWCYVDFGDFGKFKFEVPVFSYDGKQFNAQGGFEQADPSVPLQIPLTPVKSLLNACHLNALGSALPNGIPLAEIKAFDDKGNLNTGALLKLLQKAGITLPKEFTSALDAIASRLDHLPTRFKSYLDFEIPQGFTFDITVTDDGRVSGKIAVEGDKPIKILTSCFIGPLPQLMGIELYSLTLGELFGGAALSVKIDAILDFFDIITMAAAIALPLDKLPILPNSNALVNTLTLHNLFVLVLYETVIPIPIPLFCEHLRYEYLGLEGLSVVTDWEFPKPQVPDFKQLLALFTSVEKFFTDRTYLLDPNASFGAAVPFSLTVGPNYLQLPKYLSGKLLGTQTGLQPPYTAYSLLAHLLNAMKTLSLNELIQCLPLEKRVGQETLAFGFMSGIYADWLITTPKEFRDLVAKNRVPAAFNDLNATIQVLPPSPTPNDEGMVLFLRGGWKLANVLDFDCRFGEAGASGGFGTVLHVSGSIGSLFSADLRGQVVISHNSPAFAVSGTSLLRVGDHTVFTASLEMDDTHFRMQGHLDLFPDSSPLKVKADGLMTLDNKGNLYLQAAVSVVLQDFNILQSMVTITNNSATIEGQWLGVHAVFSIKRTGNAYDFSGMVLISLPLNLDTGAIQDPVTHTTIIPNISLNTSVGLQLDTHIGSSGFSASISGQFVWSGHKVTMPAFTLSVSPRDIKALGDRVEKQIKDNASSLFSGLLTPHIDVSGKHIDTPSQHADVPAAPHVDTPAQHADTPSKHGDTPQKVHVDAAAQHADTAAKHTDTASSHADSGGGHSDSTGSHDDTSFFGKAHVDTHAHWDTGKPHFDVGTPHTDATIIPHIDTTITPHVDTQPVPHVDSTLIPHVDTQTLPHIDTKTIPHTDGTAIPHGDTSTPHVDVPAKAI